MIRALLFIVAAITALSGCVSIQDINSGYFRLGRAWQLENQKFEDEYRYRVISTDYLIAFEAIRKTFIALGMPVQSSDLSGGTIYAENIAPAPLTREEWLEVKRIETPRLKEIGGKLFSFSDDPKTYIMTVRATLKQLRDGRVLISLDYNMRSDEQRRIGIDVTPHAPPAAVRFGSAKFWDQLEREVKSKGLQPPRKRLWNEES